MTGIVRHNGHFEWDGVHRLAYKEEGTHFKQVTRQVLSKAFPGLFAELRYFEVAPGGHSTLERHEHAHLVLIGRGGGHCLVGGEVSAVTPLDAVIIPPQTWHQFRATGTEPLGFFCVVARERDRPQLPSSEDLEALSADPAIKDFIRV
ncbi:quercetin dioxygenase-like cupin family protein [Rhodoblastus acidophilus]|uniref:cupin domain-containing protein n=1 Tax=Rhodoblastus acidophilus TaxID=1074 RepID=UPI002224D25C|nr:cupin domain-containing protein [Rhodoblastus acidophilus]MCW2285933.1 quercetin dioxygenase-like cupin family protein [Rhodoblastus acidophilus]MCW2334827.1 quercetin dioxygenase-like cupin family protein [Rhodoblastus acidophilus]